MYSMPYSIFIADHLPFRVREFIPCFGKWLIAPSARYRRSCGVLVYDEYEAEERLS